MDDLTRYLGAVVRSCQHAERDGKLARTVTASRRYATDIEDLWDALTNIERIPRWFLPIEGDLELGGHYQLKGNASGEITACEPPRYLAVTWVFADNVSWVTVSLESEAADRTLLTLDHTAHVPPEFWDQYGAGATGVGWDLGLMGLALHVENGAEAPLEENQEWTASEDGRAFMRASSDAWCQAAIADGEDPDWAREAAERTRKFYTGES